MKTLSVLLQLCCCYISVQAHELEVKLQKSQFEMITDTHFNQTMDFNSLDSEQNIYLTYWGSRPKAEIIYDGKRLTITSDEMSVKQVKLKLYQQTKIINFYIQGRPASYNKQYIAQHQNRVSVEIPEVYELAHILLAMSDRWHHTKYNMNSEGQYYADVVEWFSPYKEHPIFNAVNSVSYSGFIENGPAYIFSGDEIVPSSVFQGFRARDELKDNLLMLADFSKASNFLGFYQRQKKYYSTLIDVFQDGANPRDIWEWLELQFPAKYHSYKVFFSPLGAGKHSSRLLSTDGYKEAVMFISGPNRYNGDMESKSRNLKKLARTFFTEIDHAYVNPTSDSYIDEINLVLNDLRPWYRGGGYDKPYLVFNEYMTWSVFSIYAMEKYSSEDYIFMKDYIESFMTTQRGFHQFKQFNTELTRLYKNRAKDQNIPNLYDAILAWIHQHNNSDRKVQVAQ